MIHWVNDEDSVDEEHERAEACYKLLLDAGSDISSVLNDDCSSAFSVALADGDLVRRSCCFFLLMEQLMVFSPR